MQAHKEDVEIGRKREEVKIGGGREGVENFVLAKINAMEIGGLQDISGEKRAIGP